MGLPDIVGLLGAVFYLSAYALIQLRIYTVDDSIITVLNILGGVALIYSLSWNFNLGSIITQIAWLAFTIIGYVRFRVMGRRRAATAPAE
ncbi:cyclic nucleotide-binding protein [Brucella endophytica]|uniref:Cyclic nucleotide-binding protein n=2 Tax=Brucella endophytica TaxID=1963359 RepID=A0A916WG50_9HYPH|nr:cyclic nucleotide-binding protein [Brucella endophytica]